MAFKKRKRNRNGWQDFSGILNELRRSEKWGHHLSRHSVFRVWESAVGETIAKVARPVGVRGSRLQVEVGESVWMQELQLMAEDILRKLNASMGNGNLKEIHFRLGNSMLSGDELEGFEKPSLPAMVRQPVNISAEDERAAREEIRGFQDEELRASAESLLERVHSRSTDSGEGEMKAMEREERG